MKISRSTALGLVMAVAIVAIAADLAFVPGVPLRIVLLLLVVVLSEVARRAVLKKQ